MRERLPARCRLRPIVYGVMLACADSALGNPTGAQVINGTVTMARPNAQTLNVTNSPGSIIHWQGFSIGANETTRFIQQNAASTVLNRVVGADISQIYGQLVSNGRVFLINPAGIIVGAGATIDTAGFVGSSLNMTNRDFLAGNLRFQGDGNAGAVVNHGRIRTQAGGDVVLVAPRVENSGVIRTPGGEIVLAAGRKVTIGDVRHEGVQFEVQAPTDSALNLGKLIAENGAVGVFAGTIKHSGDIRATGLARDQAGRVVLKGQGDVTVAAGSRTSADGKSGGAVTVQSTDGTTLVSGDVSAKGTEGNGGDVRILGHRVGLFDDAAVNASGKTGGGQILVGGDYLGGNAEVQNAFRTFVGAGATLRADARENGDGGRVIVWSDDTTRFGGKISAHGGAQSGDGGFVETSGRKMLLVGTSAHVDTRAPAGRTGNWLLDPETVNVSTSGTAPLTAADSFTDPGTTVTIHPNTINTAVSHVLLRATDTITFSNDVSMTGAGLSLTAESGRAIFANANITTNNGDVRLVANHDHGGAYTPGASAAQLTMASGKTIDAGTANVFLRMHAGEDDSNVPAGGGHITIANLRGNNVSVFQNARATPGHSILRADGTSLITATTSVHLEVEDTTGAASIGTSSAPIRIDTPAVEAYSHNATGGIFIQSPNPRNLQIGGASPDVFTGTVRGVQTLGAGGPIEITVDGALTRLNGGDGGPIVANNKNITLSAIRLGSSGAAGRLHVDAGTGTVTATATGDGLFLEQTTGSALLSRYNLSAPATQAVELATSDGPITVDANIAMGGRDVTLIGGGTSGDILFNSAATVTAASLTLDGSGVTRFSNNVTLNAPLEINKPLEIQSGTVSFNQDSTVTVVGPGPAFTLSGGTLTGTADLTINGTGNVWSGGTMSGTGTTHITGTNTLELNGASKAFTNRTLTTDGTVTWTAGNVASTGGGVFNNNGVFDVQGNVAWFHNTGSSATVLNNAGTLRRSVGAGTADLERMLVTGAGPIEVQTGTLSVSNSGVTGTGTLTGAITVTGGATMDFAGATYVVNNTISGAGNLSVSGSTLTPQAVTTTGTLAVSSGTANFNANATPLTPSAVTVSGGTANFARELSTGGNLTISGGTASFTADATVAGSLQLSSGTLGGDGATVTINGTGSVWSGGTMSGTGTTHITGTNTLELNGASKAFTNRTLTTDGTVTWTAGNVASTGGGVFNNNGVFDVQGNVAWFHNTGSSATVLNNAGTLRRSVGAGTADLERMLVTGAGPIEVQTGTLSVSNSGVTGTGTLTGAITVTGGATMDFAGATYVVNNTISGAGNLSVSGSTLTPQAVTTTGTLAVSSGTANFNANATPLTPSAVTVSGGTANFARELSTGGNLTISGGTASFTADATVAGSLQLSSGTLGGDGATVTINGTGSVWSGGTMSGTGTTHITGTNTLELNGASKAFTNRTLTTDGTVTWTAGNVASTGGGVFNNNGVFDVQGNVAWFHNTGSSATVLNNAGTLRRSVGAGTADLERMLVTGAGPIEVQTGTLSVSNSGVTGTGTLTGAITVTGGATMDFAGATYVVNNTISGAGNLSVSGSTLTPQAVTTTGTLAVSSGTANFNANATPLTPSAVTVSGGTANFARELSTGGNLTISGGTASFTADATVAGSLQLSSGTLGGDGATVTINGTGSVWSGGTMSGTGTTHITGTNTLELNGASKAFTNRTLTTDGTVTWTAGNVASTGGGVFNNNGVFDVQGNVAWFHNTGSSATVLNNAGTLRRSVGAGTADLERMLVTGAGPIEVQTGTLSVSNSGVTGTGTLTGAITVTGGATMDFAGATYVVNNTISGAGNLSVSGSTLTPQAVTTTGTLAVSSGTANFNANATPLTPSAVTVSGGTANFARELSTGGNLTISGGTASFTADATVAGSLQLSSGTLGGDGATVTINGTGSVWSGGTMSGTGTTHITGTNTLELNGASKAFTNRTLTTDGTVTWTAGNVASTGGGVFNNNGVFDVQGNVAWFHNTGSSATVLNNAGTLRRSTSAGEAQFDMAQVNNTGTIDVQTGTLTLARFPSNDGVVEIAAGAVLSTLGNHLTNNAGGTIGGSGTLNLTNGATVRTLTNNGILRPGNAIGDETGTLTITGHLTQGASGQVNVQLGGTTAGDFDVLAVSDAAQLTGDLNLSTTNGYAPAAGDNFSVLTWGSRTGAFANVNKTFGNSVNSQYNANNLLLTLGAGGALNIWQADDGLWNVAGNWSLNHVPTAGEEVQIDVDGATVRTITVPAGTFLASNLTSNENIVIGGGSLSLTNASTINAGLTVNSGTLAGAGQITVNGNLSFTGGTIASTGGVVVNGTTNVTGGNPQLTGLLTTNALNMTAGTFDITGAGSRLSLTGTGASAIGGATTVLANAGTLRMAGTGNLQLNNGATLNNTGTLDIRTDAGFQYVTGSNVPTLTNSGTLQKSGGAGTSQIGVGPFAFNFTNSGVLEAQTGTLEYRAFNTFNGGTEFTGAGTNLVTTNSTFNDTITSANLVLQSGNFAGNASFGGTTAWTGGSMTGTHTVPSGAILNLTDAGVKIVAGTAASLTNDGTVNVVGDGNLQLNNGATLTNNRMLDFQSDAGVQYLTGNNVPAFTNNGTLRKSGGAGTSVIGISFPFNFTNNGTLDAQTGTLQYIAFNTFNDGTQFTGAGTNLVTTNSTFNDTITSANLVLRSGSFAGSASFDGMTTWTGGTITGTHTVLAGATLNLTGADPKIVEGTLASLTNNGTLNVTNAGNLRLDNGATLTNNAMLDFQGDAGVQYLTGDAVPTLTNAAGGTLKKSAGTTSVIGISFPFTFTNAGTLDAADGTTINYAANNTFSNGTQFTGTGSNLVTTNSTFTGTSTSANLTLQSGNFGGGGSLAGTTAWTGGTITGALTIPDGATLDLSGTGNKTMAGTAAELTNNGMITVTGTGNLVMNNGARLTNNGLFDFRSDAGIQYATGPNNVPTFTNNDTVGKSGGAGTSVIGISFPFNFTNNATLDAQVGTLEYRAFNTFADGTQFIGAGTNLVTNGATFTGTSTSANLVLQSGNYGGGGLLAGTTTWTGGTITGALTIPDGATLDLSGTGNKTMAGTAAELTNNGMITVTGTGNLVMNNGARLTNNGLFDFRSDAGIQYATGPNNVPTFTNNDTVGKSGGAGTSVIGISFPFNFTNNATLDAQVGTLEYRAFNTFADGTQFIGAGTNLVTNGATFTGTSTSANLVLQSGNYGGGGLLAGTTTWTGGTITGALTVPGEAMLDLSGTGDKTMAGTAAELTNNGMITVTGTGNLVMNNGARLTNNGLFDFRSDAGIQYATGPNVPTFTNNGMLTKSAGTGTSAIGISFPFTFRNEDTGTIHVQTGTLQVNGGFPTNDGTINIDAGATFSTNNASLVNNGTIGGSGTIALNTGTLTNHGTLRPGNATGDTTGTLAIASHLTQGAGGQLDVELGGTAAGDFDVVTVSGNANLAGTLNLTTTGGYVASGADSFTVLTAGARNGTFDAITASFGNSVLPAYNPTSVVVALGGAVLNQWTVNGDGDWSNVANWSRGHLPTAGEEVVIDVGGATVRTITVPAGTFAANRITSEENFVIAGGDLTLGNASTFNGAFTLNAGTLRGAGAVTLNGAFNWNGGTITGSGAFDTHGLSTLAGGLKTLTGRTWNNFGTVNWTDGNIRLSDAMATINNKPGATWNVLTNSAFADMNGPGTFNNEAGALIEANAPGLSNSINPDTVNHAGTINVRRGDLDYDNLSTVNFSGTINFSDGTRIKSYIGPGTTLNFNAGTVLNVATGGTATLVMDNHAINVNTPLTLPGGMRIEQSTSTLTADAPLTFASGATYNLTGGSLAGSGLVTLNGPFNLNGGTLANPGGVTVNGTTNVGGGAPHLDTTLTTTGLDVTGGTLNIGTSGTLNLDGGAPKTVNGATVNNQGTINLAGTANLMLENGATLANDNTIDLRSNAGIRNSAGASTFDNAGTLKKTAGTSSAIEVDTFNNHTGGSILVQSGVLQMVSGFPTNHGTIDVAAGTTFSTVGSPLVNEGLIRGNGTIHLGAATLTSNGTVSPGASPGRLVIDGNFAQGPLGTLMIDLGGTQQGVTYDLFQVNGTATLGGTLQVNNAGSFTPGSSDAFDVMTYSSRSGDFATVGTPMGSSLQGTPHATFYRLAPPGFGTSPTAAAASTVSAETTNVIVSEVERLPTILVLLVEKPKPEAKTDRTCN